MKRVIHGFKMLYGDSTNIWSFAVYEYNGAWANHSTIMFPSDLGLPGNGCAGRLGTRRLPEWIDAIPYGQKRIKTVGRWHRAQYRAAYKLILSALPQIAREWRILSGAMGDISVDILAPSKPASRSVNIPL